MKEAQRPFTEVSFIRHGEWGGNLGEGLSVTGRRQAELLGRAAAFDYISSEAPVRVVASPHQHAKETARIAYGNPIWIDNDLREYDRSMSSGESWRDVSMRGLAAAIRVRHHSRHEPHIVAITHERMILALRHTLHDGRLAHSLDNPQGTIGHGDMDSYRIHADGMIEMRTTPLGENPQEREFFEISRSD